jgi:hypothetical protein
MVDLWKMVAGDITILLRCSPALFDELRKYISYFLPATSDSGNPDFTVEIFVESQAIVTGSP